MIKITGKDIIELNGFDNTGALKELGIDYKYDGGPLDSKIYELEFEVDLDFVLRHGLLDNAIYENHYKKSEEYQKYYNEGKEAFLAGKEESPPYDTGTIADKDYWTNSIYHKRYPWFDGHREAKANFYEEKYKIEELQNKVRALIKEYGLKLKYSDEYNDPYAETPEGFVIKLA